MNRTATTVHESPSAGSNNEPRGPRLELTGAWLAEAGFPVGAQVEVTVVEPGRLVVTRLDLEGPLPNLLPLVWVPVEKLAAIEEGAAHG